MIRSYTAIHTEEHYEGQYEFEAARARQVARLAEEHSVDHGYRPDGDTTYLDACVDIPSVEDGAVLSYADEDRWIAYVEFLQALEDGGFGNLLHEVDTEAEKALVESLVDTGDDRPSLADVDVEYRNHIVG